MSDSPMTKAPRSLRDDRGFILIEVLVSALILVTVSVAVFATLSKADSAAGTQQRRSLAANVAQSELEKIRALPVEDIAALRGDRTVTYSGNTYTVNTVAKWVTDGSDEPECSTRTGGLDYLRTTVKISWTKMGQAKPITMTSLVTPAAGAGGGDTGSVSVHIINRLGNPVAGVAVRLEGPQDFTETTNANGCVVFGFVPASDSYVVKFAQANFVDANSINAVAEPTVVTGGQTTKLQFEYDQGGFTAAQFRTRREGDLPTAPLSFQMFNAGQPAGPVTVNLDGTQTSWQPDPNKPFFPFTSPYAMYAGSCAGNSVPTNGNERFVNITPLAFQNAGTVWLPALDVKVMSGSSLSTPGSPVPNARVQVDTGCSPIYERRTVAAPTGAMAGRLADPGFPYSTSARVCATNGSRKQYKLAQPNTNFNDPGTALTLYLSGTGSSSTSSGAASCF